MTRGLGTCLRAGVGVLAGVALLAGCELPGAPVEEASPTTTSTALGSEPPDPRDAHLTTALEELRRSVAAARHALATAQTAAGDEATTAAETAVALLAAQEEIAEEEPDPDPRPLFPGPVVSREETVDYGDAFTETLSAARAAGSAGAPVLDLLRDPVAGDVGTWQRDAEGMLEQIDDAARPTDDVAEAEASVAELAGEGTRALAWALLAAGADDDDLRSAFAERGVAHLDIVLAAVDDALADAAGRS